MVINKLPEMPCLMNYNKVKAICTRSPFSSE